MLVCPWTPYAAIKPQDASNGDDSNPAIRVPAFLLLLPGVVYQRKKREGADPAVVAEFSLSEQKKNTHTNANVLAPLRTWCETQELPVGNQCPARGGKSNVCIRPRHFIYNGIYIHCAVGPFPAGYSRYLHKLLQQ